MITAVDTNILIDIFNDDPSFCRVSTELLKKCISEGAIVICDIVLAEVATMFYDQIDLKNALQNLQIVFSPMSEESSLFAAKIWRSYRQSGGSRKRLVSDFLIAAHATCQCDRLLSRDRGFYRNYFKNLCLIDPTPTTLKRDNCQNL